MLSEKTSNTHQWLKKTGHITDHTVRYVCVTCPRTPNFNFLKNMTIAESITRQYMGSTEADSCSALQQLRTAASSRPHSITTVQQTQHCSRAAARHECAQHLICTAFEKRTAAQRSSAKAGTARRHSGAIPAARRYLHSICTSSVRIIRAARA